MTSTIQLRYMWRGYLCTPNKYGTAIVPASWGFQTLTVAQPAVAAFDALGRVMEKHNYLFRETKGGAYNCRHVNDDPAKPWSLHAYGIAVDINPSKNGFGDCDTDMPTAFVADVLRLRTKSGMAAFSWGGNWRPCSIADPMHFQIDCSPAHAASGIADEGDDDMPTADEIREIIRDELDRTSDGKPATKYSVWGLMQSVFSGKIGNSGLSAAQNWDETLKAVRRIEKKVDEL